MFQFTTTNILNTNLDSNGVTQRFTGVADPASLIVTRVGTFLTANVVGNIQKRAYTAAVLEVAEVTVPVIEAGRVARLDVDIRLSQQTHSEYANAMHYFTKPVCVEVIATGVAATDADNLVAELNSLKDRFGHSYITATAAAGVITLTAKDPHQRFYDVKVLKEDPDALTNSIIEPVFIDVTAGTFAVTTDGLIGFGNDEWMYSRIRMQSLENHRPFGIARDELPVIGGNYTQYTLRYRVTKDHTDGVELSNNDSVTTHVFYVKSDQVAAFETEIGVATLSIDTITPA